MPSRSDEIPSLGQLQLITDPLESPGNFGLAVLAGDLIQFGQSNPKLSSGESSSSKLDQTTISGTRKRVHETRPMLQSDKNSFAPKPDRVFWSRTGQTLSRTWRGPVVIQVNRFIKFTTCVRVPVVLGTRSVPCGVRRALVESSVFDRYCRVA